MQDLTGKVYVEVRKKTVIKVLGLDTGNSTKVRIVTITPMGDRVRERTIDSHRLTGQYLTLMGRPRRNGYIEVKQLPSGHLLSQLPAVKQATGLVTAAPARAALRMEEVDLGELSDEALVLYLKRVHDEYEWAQKNLDDAKREAKSRSKNNGGLVILNGVTVELYRASQVDDTLAKRNLPKERYEAICKTKVDAATARVVLSEDELKLTLKPKDWTCKVRETTETDLAKAAEAVVDAFGRPIGTVDAEVFDLHGRTAA